MASSLGAAVMSIVLDNAREGVIQRQREEIDRQREEIERLRMAAEDYANARDVVYMWVQRGLERRQRVHRD